LVPDVEAALQKAESLGGTRVMGPETIMEGSPSASSSTLRAMWSA
jgi:hypothetical protein